MKVRMHPRAAHATLAGAGLPRLLIVDDEVPLRALYSHLSSVSYEVFECDSATDALDFLHRQPVDVLLTDLDMPGMNGLTLIERVRLLSPRPTTVMMTGTSDGDSRRLRAKHLGVPILSKPFGQEELLRFLDDARSQRRAG